MGSQSDEQTRLRILVVEDSSTEAGALKALLERKFDAKVEITGDCASARDRIASGTFDIVTLDYQLPDGDGLGLLEEIREGENSPPVVMVTGHGDEQTAVNAFKLGAAGYVVKDKRLSSMLPEAVEHALSEVALKRAISARIEAEEALIKEKSLLDSTLDSIEDIFYLIDLEGNAIRWNRRLNEVSGYSDEEISNMNALDLFPPDERQRVAEGMQLAIKVGRGRLEVDIVAKDGVRIPYEYLAVLARDSDGNPIGLCGTGRDLTERRRAEGELRESEERFRAFSDASIDGIVIHEEGKILAANRSVGEMIGVDPKRFVGADGFQFIHPDYFELVTSNMRSGYEEPYEVVLIRADGSTFEAEVTGKNVHYKGRDARVLVVRDLTERKSAESELLQTKERLEFILEASGAVVYIAEPFGNYAAKYISKNVTELTGYEPAEFLDDPDFWIEHVHHYDAGGVFHEVQRLIEKGSHVYEYRFKYKDGSYHWIRDEMRLILDAEGKPFEIVGFWVDITDHKRTEGALRESEERLRLLYEYANYAVFIYDTDMKIIAVNRTTCEQSGYSEEELLGRNVLEVGILHTDDIPFPDDLEKSAEVIKGLFSDTGVTIRELRFLSKDGSTVLVEVTGAALHDRDGNIVAYANVARDITQQKKAEEEVRLARDRLRATLEAVPDLLFEVDTDGKIYDYYASDVESLYVPPNAFIGKTIEQVLPDEAAAIIVDAIGEAKVTGRHVGSEYSLEMPGGTRWYELSISSIGDVHAPERRFIAIVRDITDRKSAEDALVEEKAFTDIALNRLADAFVVFDVEGRPIRWNTAFSELTGYGDEEIADMNALDFHMEEEQHRVGEWIAEVLETDSPLYIEVTLAAKDGRKPLARLSGAPLRDQDGHVVGVVGTGRDITDIRRITNERERLVQDLEVRVKELNCFFELARLVEKPGTSLSEILCGAVEIVPPAFQYPEITCARITVDGEVYVTENCRETDWRISSDITIRGERIGSLDVCYLEEKPVADEGPFLAEELKVIKTLAEFLGRIIERKSTEEELVRINAELEGYAHTVSHDLQGPLSNIIFSAESLADVLQDRIVAQDRSDIDEILRAMSRSARRAFDRVEVLLSLAEAGQMPEEVSDVDINEIVREVLEEYSRDIEEKNIVVKADPDMGEIRADRTQLYQIFANLIVNAIRHNRSKEPEIEILRLEEKKGAHRYLVRDNGDGIRANEMSKIFLPFFKGRGKEGTGTGLASAERVIKVYGGEIEAYNDNGACFEFFIYDHPG